MDSKKPKKPDKKRKTNPLVPKPGIHPHPKSGPLLWPFFIEETNGDDLFQYSLIK
jgi:hypothetical protein